ncbi:unnamed protein product [Bursaphelenchus xylophilus]|uniref:(pine wood nematode) hypothetical protein n=1 Tax=Bursaphelenchus xylophilus TaxID=6326 RepID=A0A811KLT2_BURXY|nr:unnamed protein product [Bursaphelenchus xylophilus]CAG9100070.1 unnamed protein product [Bursaphelenchus xylophilus]
MSTNPEGPPTLDQPKDSPIIDQKPSVSRSNSVDSSILVIDEDSKDVKEPDTTMEDDDLPPALESQPRAEEMEQVPAFEAPKVENAEKVEDKPPSPPKVSVPKVTLTPSLIPISGPTPSNLIPVTTISASVATAALNSLANSTATTTTSASPAVPTPPKKPRAPRKQAKKQPPPTSQPQYLTPIHGIYPGMPMQYMSAASMMLVNGKPVFVHQGPRPMQVETSKNNSPPNTVQRVQYIQPSMTGAKNNIKMQPQLIQVPPGFIAQQQQQNRQGQQPQQIQVKPPQFVSGGPLRQSLGDCHMVPFGGQMALLNQQNQIVGYCKVAQNSNANSVMAAEPPPKLSPNPQQSTSDEKAPQAKKIKLAEAENGPSTSEKISSGGQIKIPVSQPHFMHLKQAFKIGVPKELLTQMGQSQVISNGNEEKPPSIEMATFNAPLPALEVQKTVFREEASCSSKFQPKPGTKVHQVQGFTIQEPDFTPPPKETKGVHNYIFSPQSSTPSTPLSNPSSIEIKEKRETERKSEKIQTKEKTIQKLQKENKVKPKVGRKTKVEKPAEFTPKLAPKVEKHPSSTPRKMPEHGVKKIKSAGNTPQSIEDKRLRKKNRELEGLLNMDFGPGKNPFKTTSADTFRDEVLISQQQIQKHVQAEEKPHPSEIRAVSRTPAAPPRRVGRPSNDKKADRPRRSMQNSSGYKKLFDDDFEEEDNSDSVIDDESERQSVKSQISEGGCLFCHKASKSKKNPQYCNKCQVQEKLGHHVDLGGSQDSNGLEHSECSSTSSSSRPPSTKPAPISSLPPQPSPSRHLQPSTSVPHPIQKVAPIPENPKNGGHLGMDELKKRPVASWSLDEVAAWAAIVHCSDVVINELKEQEIDGDALVVLLQQQQLRSGLSLKLGPAVKLERDLRAILEEQKALGVV